MVAEQVCNVKAECGPRRMAGKYTRSTSTNNVKNSAKFPPKRMGGDDSINETPPPVKMNSIVHQSTDQT